MAGNAHSLRFRFGAQEFAVIALPAVRARPAVKLSAAEKHVIALILEGRSNAQIAKKRGTAARTVANQVSSIFRKLSVSSRAELVALIGAVP